MIPRADSDNPIDRIRFGLMIAMSGEDSSETLELVKQQEVITRRELKEVPERAQARGAEFLDFSKISREGLIESLETYLEWLSKTLAALEQQDSSGTVEAYESSQEILPDLNEALDTYSNDFARFGPFESIPANTLIRIAEAIEQGQLDPGGWTEYCSEYAKWTAKRSAGIATLQLPGKTALQECYQNFADSISKLRQEPPKTAASVQAQLKEMDAAIQGASQLEEKMDKPGEGPTSLPGANVLLRFLEPPHSEFLESVVIDYGEQMDAYAEQFEGAASRPTESALVQEEIPRTLDALDAHYAAIEALSEGLESKDSGKIDEAKKQLLETASKLEESKDVYATADLHQSQITCVSCSRSNPPENRNCEACGEILPRNEDPSAIPSSTFSLISGPALEENQQLEMTENVARLFQACDDVNDGVITTEKFTAELQFASKGLKDYAEELDSIAATALDEDNFTEEQLEVWRATHLPYLEDVGAAYNAGMDEAKQGLESMEVFLSDANREHLVEGIRLVWQGLSTMHRARLSVESYTNMLTDVMQEAADEGLISGEE